MTLPFTEIVRAAWEQAMRESPNHFEFAGDYFLGPPLASYRERLDRRVKNVYGDVIPRITLVRANIRSLGKPKTRPRLPG